MVVRFARWIPLLFILIASAAMAEDAMRLPPNVELAPAQPPLGIPPISHAELIKLESALPQLSETLWDEVEKASRAIRFDCLKDTGNDHFCSCIAESIPVLFSFEDYVAITTHTLDELNFESLDPDYRQAIDATIGARDSCVRKHVQGGDEATC